MRKAILLAMAAAIVAMFAIPGSASAAWTEGSGGKHIAIGADVELEITGTDIYFESDIGGVTCNQTISKVLFEAANGGTTGTVKTFEPETSPTTTITADCQGRGALAQCDVHEATADRFTPLGEASNLEWPIHTVSPDTVSITTGSVTNTLTGFLCPHTSTVTGGTVHLTTTAGQTLTTSTAHLSGTLTAHIDAATKTIHVSGEVHVLGTIKYGI